MFSRSGFVGEGEVGRVAGTIDIFSLDTMEMERLFLERDVVRNIYWLGLLCDL